MSSHIGHEKKVISTVLRLRRCAAQQACVKQVKEIGGMACCVVGDLCSDQSSKEAVQEAMRLMGGACTFHLNSPLQPLCQRGRPWLGLHTT